MGSALDVRGDLPPSSDLLGQVDTALDAASRWVSRGLQTRPADKDGWENATYFSRVLLTRAADSFAKLGYSLQRDSLEGQLPESRLRVRSALAYWQEALVDLDGARQASKEIADSSPADLVARRTLSEVNSRVQAAEEWVSHMAETLSADRGPDRLPPVPSVFLTPEQHRPDDGPDYGVA